MKHIGYGISVSDSSQLLKNYSNFTTTSKGGERAVSEACFHILHKFFNFKIQLKTNILDFIFVLAGNDIIIIAVFVAKLSEILVAYFGS